MDTLDNRQCITADIHVIMSMDVKGNAGRDRLDRRFDRMESEVQTI